MPPSQPPAAPPTAMAADVFANAKNPVPLDSAAAAEAIERIRQAERVEQPGVSDKGMDEAALFEQARA